MEKRQMQLVMQLGSVYGVDQGAWRMPGVDPKSFLEMDSYIEYARVAERGKIQMVFIADSPVLSADISYHPPLTPLDPILTMTAIARETTNIGIVGTISTTYNHPYNVARQLKALDVLSHGRIGWNAVTTSNSMAAFNFGETVPSREERYERANEFIQIVQALWGSWEESALLLDAKNGHFADMERIKPISLKGKYMSSRGPLPIPPSPQGQPVIFQAGGGELGMSLAGKYASGVYANPYDIETSRAYRQSLRARTEHFGRSSNEVKVFPGIIPSIASTEREALERRKQLDELLEDLNSRVVYLGSMIGIPLSYKDMDQPIAPELLRYARTTNDPRSSRVLELALKGLSVRDILAHGVINYHPVIAGTPEQVADFMEKWFVEKACDGFAIQPDINADGVADFVDHVVPILQKRGLFHKDYEGSTLRENMGIPYQYGLLNE